MRHALVAVAGPLRGLYSYSVPAELAELSAGHLIEVPFGRGRRRGVVVELGGRPPAGVAAKPIARLVEPEPVIRPALLATLRWAAEYYLAAPGEMIFAALPPVMRRPAGRADPRQLAVAAAVTAAPEPAGLERRAPRQATLLRELRDSGPRSVAALERERSGARAALAALERKGLVTIALQAQPRRPAAETLPAPAPVERLSAEQQRALETVIERLDDGAAASVLLHGVTGSGKTEVYLRAMQHALDSGRGALLMVPEIALTPQLTQRVAARFGRQVAVLHSGLGQGERLDEWRRLQTGRARIALGARSAVFAPVERLGLLVVDEEHDGSYKQSERLPYNGRDLALVRAREEGAVVLLGSATPSLESYARARAGRSALVELRQRIHARPLPAVEMVDLRRVLDPIERVHALSPPLADALAETLDAGGQAILFLNRRGYSAFALCRDCGEAVRCQACSVALVHHLSDESLRCHYCGHTERLPLPCPACGSKRVQMFGLGTEKVEQEVGRRFPGARVIRLDSDAAAGRGALQRAMGRFARGEADVLVGTQMVTKGHDIPGVTLVGVVLADLGLHLPDFRAAERTFQQLLQVAGRAGRGDGAGRVVVQSFLPGHESLELARQNRYADFVSRELERRKVLGYPPARRLMMIRISHPDADRTRELALAAGRLVRDGLGGRVQLLGPVPSPLARLRGRHRWQMLVKSQRIEDLHRAAGAVRSGVKIPARGKILFDVDPFDML